MIYSPSVEIPRVIFIDWDGTLSVSKFWEQFEQPDHPLNLYFSKIQAALFSPSAPLAEMRDAWGRGSYSAEQIVNELSKIIALDQDTILRELRESCQSMVFVTNEIPTLIQQIRSKGPKVVIATDNMDTFSRWTTPALKLSEHFDGVLNSANVKALKSDLDPSGNSLFFKDYLEENHLSPQECLIIDDSQNNQGPLSSFGINYHLIEPGTGLVPKLREINQLLAQ